MEAIQLVYIYLEIVRSMQVVHAAAEIVLLRNVWEPTETTKEYGI